MAGIFEIHSFYGVSISIGLNRYIGVFRRAFQVDVPNPAKPFFVCLFFTFRFCLALIYCI